MILDLIKELAQLSALNDPLKEQSKRRLEVMRELRSQGFGHHEIWILAGKKGPEDSVRRQIGRVTILDKTEHDQIIAELSDFALHDYKLEDIDVVKRNDLKADDVRKNIDLNEDLQKRGLTPPIQVGILEAVKKFGEPTKVLQALNQFEHIEAIIVERNRLDKENLVINSDIKQSKLLLEKQNLEAEKHRTTMKIVKQLVADYSFDYDSLDNLLSLAKKYGDPLQVIGAVNAYGNILDMKKQLTSFSNEVAVDEKELEIIKGKIKEADAEYKKLMALNAEANRLLGEIKANEQQSMRLQTISSLLQQPQKTRSTADELSRITVALLNGVAECAKVNPDYPDSFKMVIKDVEVTIASINNYLRGH